MNTLAIVLIIFSLIIIDVARRGRISNVGQDISDAFMAFISQDSDALGEVLKRRGDGLTANEADIDKWNTEATNAFVQSTANAAAGTGTSLGTSVGNALTGNLLQAVLRLGKAAKGYRWTATGPDYYDCSGLIWRACKETGIYTGPRFTTATVSLIKNFTRVTTPAIGDIVVWPANHMGIVTGSNQMYSARSTKSGIGYSSISGHGGTPHYLRVTSRGN